MRKIDAMINCIIRAGSGCYYNQQQKGEKAFHFCNFPFHIFRIKWLMLFKVKDIIVTSQKKDYEILISESIAICSPAELNKL